MVIRSTSYDQSEILQAIIKLHMEGKTFDCDSTYGNGCFYKNITAPFLKFDISPQLEYVNGACSTDLPLKDGGLNSLIFDPPFLTYIKDARNHKKGEVTMSKRFGGYWAYSDLEDHYLKSFKEAHRVLKKKGIYVVKCQDIIHNHRMHATHHMVINRCEEVGFRLKDLFILNAKHRMPSPQKGTQRHARVFHSYFLVFIKK